MVMATTKPLSSVAEAPFLKLLTGGAMAHREMLEIIASATQTVHLEMYAFADDAVGRAFIAALCERAAAGVSVNVVIDGWGSLSSAGAVVEALRAGGCRARVHNPASRMLFGRFGSNHRKFLHVDDSAMVLGGINIGEEFVGWDDLAVALRGASLSSLLQPQSTDPRPIRVVLSRFRQGHLLRRIYVSMVHSAKHHVVLAHAYFLPDRPVLQALRKAQKRGARVTLLLPQLSDVPVVQLGTRSLYRTLLRAGVDIYERRDVILHAKVAVVDSQTVLIGSFNLDPLSLANLEALVQIDDPTFAHAVEEWIDSRIAFADRVVPDARVPRKYSTAWLLDLLGAWVRRLAALLSRFVARR